MSTWYRNVSKVCSVRSSVGRLDASRAQVARFGCHGLWGVSCTAGGAVATEWDGVLQEGKTRKRVSRGRNRIGDGNKRKKEEKRKSRRRNYPAAAAVLVRQDVGRRRSAAAPAALPAPRRPRRSSPKGGRGTRTGRSARGGGERAARRGNVGNYRLPRAQSLGRGRPLRAAGTCGKRPSADSVLQPGGI